MVTQKDVYQLYEDVVKPLYCEIEAQNNTLPVELLFETYAAFDHLKRIYIECESEEECCKKALSHIKRGALDAFKLKLKYFNSDVKSFMRSGEGLSLIDNGQFLINLTADRAEINTLAKKARSQEGRNKDLSAFDPWYETSLKIDTFKEVYLERRVHLLWASRYTYGILTKQTLAAFVIGCLSSWFVWYFTSNHQDTNIKAISPQPKISVVTPLPSSQPPNITAPPLPKK